MTAVRGRVHAGRVELGGDLPDGTNVVVLTTERDDAFDLAETEVAELEARIAAADRGEVVAASDVIRKLRSAR